MADEDRISETYRVAGIYGIASANVFRRIRIARKTKKTDKEEKILPKESEEQNAKIIDIEA